MSVGRPTEGGLLLAIREAAGTTHEIIGEIARGVRGGVAVLARARASGELVVLNVSDASVPSGGAAPKFTEHARLDASVPSPSEPCHACRAPLADWQRRCPVCGSDEAVVVEGSTPDRTRAALLTAVRAAAGNQYELLGDIQRMDGGRVYFAREQEGGGLAVLRLLPAPTGAEGDAGAFVLVATPCTPAGGSAAGQSTSAMQDVAGPSEAYTKVCPQCGMMYGSVLKFCPTDGAGLRLLASPTDLIGQIIADRFCVLSKIGEGGMGEVYLAEHVQLGRRCAVKVMRRALLHDHDAAMRFRREAMNASVIAHPNVATIFDFIEASDGDAYLVMEYVDGEPLSQLLAHHGALPPWRVADIGRQVADALAAAHDLGIVHRDLKPDNIVIAAGRDGRDVVKVVDFGIAKAVESAQQQVTRTGLRIGTPAFMSPEQLRGDPLDGRSDLYSLGCILFEMLTGQRATEGDTDEVVIARRFTDPPAHPRRVDPSVPDELDELVASLLARSPDERPASATEVSRALTAMGLEPMGEQSAPRAGAARPSAARISITGVERVAASAPLHGPLPVPTSPPIARRIEPQQRGASAADTTVLTREAKQRRHGLVILAFGALVGVTAILAWPSSREPGSPRGSDAAIQSGPAPTAPSASTEPTTQAPDEESRSAGNDQEATAAPSPDTDAPAARPAPAREAATRPARDPALLARLDEARDDAATARHAAGAAGASADDLAPGDALARNGEQAAEAGRASDALEQFGLAAVAFDEARQLATARADSIERAASADRERETALPTPEPANPPPVQESAEDAERAAIAAVRDVIIAYVQALHTRDLTTVRTLFPGAPDGLQRTMREASDWSVTLNSGPAVTVNGETARADFGYVLDFHLPSTGRQSQTLTLRADLRRTSDGWRILAVSAAR